jgi:hypothetical protein
MCNDPGTHSGVDFRNLVCRGDDGIIHLTGSIELPRSLEKFKELFDYT